MSKPAKSPVVTQPVNDATVLPFGPHYQMQLLRLFLSDTGLAYRLYQHIKPEYFELDVLRWAYACALRHQETYQVFPTLNLLLDLANRLEPSIQPVYTATLERVREADIRDEQWLKDQTLEFVRRNIFVRMHMEQKEIFNSGDMTAAYDRTMEMMESIHQVRLDDIDRGWLFEEFDQRQEKRMRIEEVGGNKIPTGLDVLDHLLSGGASPGELLIWLGYAKGGKSTLLVHIGKACIRSVQKPFLHCVLEGSRDLIENRYDTTFAEEYMRDVRRGKMGRAAVESLALEYRLNRRLAVVRGFTENWDNTILDIDGEIKDLKMTEGFDPSMIIIDYGDLLNGRKNYYRSKTDNQVDAYRDQKSLANRGYVVWTASQARRPEKDVINKPHLIASSEIADAYEKVRVCDFIASINQTPDERKAKVARLYYELARDNAMDQTQLVHADFDRMTIKERSDEHGAPIKAVHAETRQLAAL